MNIKPTENKGRCLSAIAANAVNTSISVIPLIPKFPKLSPNGLARPPNHNTNNAKRMRHASTLLTLRRPEQTVQQ
jgi:hypothetical protein